MSNLEELLDKAYDDIEEVEEMFNNATQENKSRTDYAILKRKLVCDRIGVLLQEIKLDKEYGIVEKPEPIKMAEFFLDNVAQIHKIDKILYKKETAVAKQFGF